MKIILVLVFMISLVISGRLDDHLESAIAEPKSRFAMSDDVHLLATGLLQLGRGLQDFVIKTKTQMDDIFQRLNIFDRSFSDILQQTNEMKEEEQQLKKATTKLQSTEEEMRNVSLQLNSKIDVLAIEKIQLKNKVGKLEEKITELVQTQLDIHEPREIASLKNFVEQQDGQLKHLLKIVQLQHDQLTKQQGQIQDLEEKISSPNFQEDSQLFSAMEDDRHPKLKKTAKNSNSRGNATDCTWIYNTGERSNGIYSIKPNGSKAFNVYCEMEGENPWTIIQKRSDGSVDFNQTWESYIDGFGNLEGEFWLGLQKIYSIVDQADYILRIELEDWRANKRYIEYTFKMGGPDRDYALFLSRITGNIPNALPEQKEIKFSTKDHSNSTERKLNCTESDSGGWWYNVCEETNLNGRYIRSSSKGKLERRKQGLYWKPQKGKPYLLKSTKLMIYTTDLETFD
ncbi:PREDICTED: angiopoietin-related protein 3 [Thamnophis sirtalis]|uniref:Angiopoietin-related protein 3 n=1 Tax=Thamnophis sirtalis TaxID=35019 RepID=A0A6I9Z425_9SAUR|nr:PREDICTED: angiopoietin-related protein 3 [Thamnophis sirtalis]